MKLIELNIDKIIEICKRFHVRKLWVFGSILTPRFREESDIDLCVDFDRSKIKLLDYADNFFDFQYALEDLFGRRVDLTEDTAVKNPYFREELDETRRLIYGYPNCQDAERHSVGHKRDRIVFQHISQAVRRVLLKRSSKQGHTDEHRHYRRGYQQNPQD